MEILLFFSSLGPLRAQIYVRLVSLPRRKGSLWPLALAADCRAVIHQLVGGERATAATYGGAEIRAVLMMSLRFLEVRLLFLFPSDYGPDKYIDPGQPRCERWPWSPLTMELAL